MNFSSKLLLSAFCFALVHSPAHGAEFFVATNGDDANPGTSEKPFATLQRAQQAVRKARGEKKVFVNLRGGVYYLPDTLVVTAEDSGENGAEIYWQSAKDETAVISGGAKLDPAWEPFRDGIVKAKMPAGFTTDQLFVNGERQAFARFPNFNPGEWFLDAKTDTLYFDPPQELDLAKATVEGVRLKCLVEFRGDQDHPAKFIYFRDITFRHAAQTLLEKKETLPRNDWAVYRGGAIFFNGAEDCVLDSCVIDQTGGNAVFVSNYNRRHSITSCNIAKAGANGIAFIGSPDSVREPFSKEHLNFADIDKAAGPKTDNYPSDCLVEDCFIHETGRIEKQTAAIAIDMAMSINVRHCTICDVPRAGIDIGSGCFGGHLIELCDVFDTAKESGECGAFHSFGRDRFWKLDGIDLNTITLGENKDLPRADAFRPIMIRTNRWRCDHGCDIDLGDGATHYEIRSNLCLNGGIKMRDGFYRIVENNIIVNNSLQPQNWYGNSQDIFRNNIVFTPYRPIEMKKPWGKKFDENLLHEKDAIGAKPATQLQEQSGRDEHSIVADAMFTDSERGNFTLKDGSPALKFGFQNFPMDQFGVESPELKAIARSPEMPDLNKPVAGQK